MAVDVVEAVLSARPRPLRCHLQKSEVPHLFVRRVLFYTVHGK